VNNLNLINILKGFLSRKFLAPIVGTLCFIVWQNFLPVVPVEIFASFVGALILAFIGFEGIKDIIIALASIKKDK